MNNSLDEDEVLLLGGRNADGVATPAFFVNQRVLAMRDGIFSPATVEVVEANPDANNSNSANAHFYYVHFADADRRMDTWVTAESLRNAVSQGPRRTKASGKPPSRPLMTRRLHHLAAEQQQQQQGSSSAATNGGGGGSLSSSQAAGATMLGSSSTELGASALNNSATGGNIQSGGGAGAGPVSHAGKHPYSGHTRNTDSRFFDRPKNVSKFFIGEYEVESWYFSPFLLAHPAVRTALENGNNLWSSIPGSLSLTTVGAGAVNAAAAAAASASGAGAGGGGVSSTTGSSAAVGAGGASAVGGGAAMMSSSSSSSFSSSSPSSLREFTLHLCPFCFEPALDFATLSNHLCSCAKRPPGREVYRDPTKRVVVFECDGAVHSSFGKNLALVSKAFLEHKSLDYDMCPFVFYVFCRYDTTGCKICGYFSREKRNPEGYNLSCILTLPQYQGGGLGRFLIDMSYEMNRREGRPGTPEKPLSDFGERIYHSAWRERVLDALATSTCLEQHATSIDNLIRTTSMIRTDVCTALSQLKILDSKALPQIKIVVDPELLRQHLKKRIKRLKEHIVFEPALFHWFPQWYVSSMSQAQVHARVGIAASQQIVIPTEEALKEAAAQQQNSSSSSSGAMNAGGGGAGRRRQRNG